MRNKFYLIIFILLAAAIFAQPRISGRVGMGYSSPNYKTFAKDPFPSLGALESLMLNFSFSYQFYDNARVGYSQWYSTNSDKFSGEDFARSFNYRTLMIETFFFPRKKLELNFMFGPMINSGKISLTSSETDETWSDLLTEFDNGEVSGSATDDMTITFIGVTSAVGFRYYIKPYMAAEFKAGFIENYYKKENWSFRGEKVTGPNIDIEDLPLFTFGIVYGL